MADNLYLPQVDYTSRDYSAIRADLISLIDNFAPQWTSRDSTDFGIVLLELFAYAADVLNYYIDRAANESFINTATQRDTVLALAKLLNYVPNDVSPATGTVTFTNATASPQTIYAGTQLAATSATTGEQVIYETDTTVVVPAKAGSVNGVVTAAVTQGYTVSSELVGVSDGSVDQEFKLSSLNAITGTSIVNGVKTYSITATVGTTTYTKIYSLVDASATSNVFTTRVDGDGYTYIKFGDGTFGSIPAKNSSVYVTYRVGVGAAGNVASGAINSLYKVFQGTTPTVTVTNVSATSGGADAESTDSIRINAPKAFRTMNRAVSLDDYETLALQVPGVAKAKAVSSGAYTITLYVVPSGGGTVSSTLKSTIQSYFVGKTPPSVSLTVKSYVAVYPDIRVTLTSTDPAYDTVVLKAQVIQALYDLLAFDAVTLNDTIYESDIRRAAEGIKGVNVATVTGLAKKTILSDSTVPSTVSTLLFHADELPVLSTDYIVVS